jgi:hypothetical protein
MDVDIPPNEEAMETDPPLSTNNTNTDTDNMIPHLTRKDSVLDTDGDEVMQEGEGEEEGEEGMYEDIEIGDAAAEEGVGEGIEAENIEYDKEKVLKAPRSRGSRLYLPFLPIFPRLTIPLPPIMKLLLLRKISHVYTRPPHQYPLHPLKLLMVTVKLPTFPLQSNLPKRYQRQ